MKKTLLLLAMMLSATTSFADTNGKQQCSLKTLNGKYLYVYNGSFTSADGTKGTFASSGYEIYYGNGTGIGVYEYADDAGVVSENIAYSITYTINPDCSSKGATKENVSGVQATFTNHVDPSGNSFSFIQTFPTKTVAAGSEYRVGGGE